MELILREFKGLEIIFDNNGWVNATQTAKSYGKNVKTYLRGKRFKHYFESVKKIRGAKNTPLRKDIIGKGKEQGVYLHPYLAVEFARYLDSDFAVQMDMWFEQEFKKQIDKYKDKYMSEMKQNAELGRFIGNNTWYNKFSDDF